MLESVKWLRCTRQEAEQYKGLNYDVYNDANGRQFRPPGSAVPADQPDSGAFFHHFEGVAKAERALEDAGTSATYDESLMDGRFLDPASALGSGS